MTTEEIAELFLAHLYELAEEAPHPNFLFSVNDFIPKLGRIDREEIQKAIDYLGDRGFVILASFDMLGGIGAGITIEGSVFVEKGGETGIIEQYRKRPQTLVRTPPVPSLPPIDQGNNKTGNEEKQSAFFARRAVEAILEDIADILDRDDTVTVETKNDLLSDLATLKIQLERNVKNRQVIDVILGNLSIVPSIAPFAMGLKHIIEAYLR
jgi:hypothetical protein